MRAVDLFSGFGGLSLGAAEAGLKVIHAFDHDEVAVRELASNKSIFTDIGSKLSVSLANIHEMSDAYSDFAGIDLVLAGPPCQPFSSSGNRKGKNDVRDGLTATVYAIHRIRPKYFVIENVFGLAFAAHHRYLDAIKRGLAHPELVRLHKGGGASTILLPSKVSTMACMPQYDVKVQILNAADFGASQRRRRLFIVGVRRDLAVREYAFPDPTHSRDALLRAQFESKEYWREVDVKPPKYFIDWASHRKLIRGYASAHTADYHTSRWGTMRDAVVPPNHDDPWSAQRPGAKAYKSHSGAPLDWPTNTIKAGVHGVPGGENTVQYANNKFRYLTLRECATSQGFPNTYAADASFTRCMKLIGNAVPVMLGKAVIQALPQ